MGYFIVIEGADGCGKGTQRDLLVDFFTSQLGRPASTVFDPGGTAIGLQLRELLLNKELAIDTVTQAMLFMAAKRALCPTIESKLRHSDVICDRWLMSTLVYQGHMSSELSGKQLAMRNLIHKLADASEIKHPHLYVLLDISHETAAARLAARAGSGQDRFESQPSQWQARLCEAYRLFGAGDRSAGGPDVVMVDGNQDTETVHRAVVHAVLKNLPELALNYTKQHLWPSPSPQPAPV